MERRCNNCHSREHFYKQCDEPLNKENKKIVTDAANKNSETCSKYVRSVKYEMQKKIKEESETENIHLIYECMERQLAQLELINDSITESILHFNRNGMIIGREQVNDAVKELKTISEDTTVLTASAGGRAAAWDDDWDTTAECDYYMFLGRRLMLMQLREEVHSRLFKLRKHIKDAELEAAALFFYERDIPSICSRMIREFEFNWNSSASTLQYVFRSFIEVDFRRMKENKAAMDALLKKLREKFNVTQLEVLRTSLEPWFLKGENIYLKAKLSLEEAKFKDTAAKLKRAQDQVERLAEHLEVVPGMCKICTRNSANMRLNCSHVICYDCLSQVDPGAAIKRCPFCREYTDWPFVLEIKYP